MEGSTVTWAGLVLLVYQATHISQLPPVDLVGGHPPEEAYL